MTIQKVGYNHYQSVIRGFRTLDIHANSLSVATTIAINLYATAITFGLLKNRPHNMTTV